MTLMIAEDVNLLSEIFLVAGNEYIFGCLIFSTIPKVFHKGLGEGRTVYTRWVEQSNIKGGDILVGREIPGYNSGRKSWCTLFCIKTLVLLTFFK